MEYELIDSGEGEKLERFGVYRIVRPDPRIIWQKKASADLWNNADAIYIRTSSTEGNWNIKKQPPNPWIIRFEDISFTLRPTEFKHIGIFPEQSTNWNWIIHTINHRKMKILNLFAYTGGATMAAASAGAHVTHVDSAKGTIDWAVKNYHQSKLPNDAVRWIEDDAYKFVTRETKRGNTYDGIIMDPPRFGRGPKGEVWKLEHDLPKLLSAVKQLLAPHLKLFLINAYTADISPIALENAARDILPLSGTFESGELTLTESTAKRQVPNGIFMRWNL